MQHMVRGFVCLAFAAGVSFTAAAGLPTGYTPIEYVQGDGNAYIDLGVKFSQADCVACDLMITSSDNQMIYGSRTSSSASDNFMFGINSASAYLDFCNTSGGRIDFPIAAPCLNVRLTSYCSATNRFVRNAETGTDIKSSATSVSGTFTTPQNVCLFLASGGPYNTAKFLGRIYSFTDVTNGVTRMDLVPCKNAAGAVGLYDVANADKGDAAFHANAGSGSFIAGPSLFGLVVEPIPDQTFTGAAIVPDVQVAHIGESGPVPLTKDSDYTVTCENNVGLGTARMTITGIGTYADEPPIETTFEIVAPSDEGLELAGDFSRQTIVAGWSVTVPGLALKGADGQPLAADSYETGIMNAAATGMATVWARVTSGVHEGAVVARTLPVAVVPAEYMPVAWIGATGDQWVDTGVVPVKARTGVDIRFGQVKNANNQALFAQKWDWNGGFLFQLNPGFKFQNNREVPGYAAGRDYHVTIAPGGTVTMDYGAGETAYTGFDNGTSAGTTLGLFAPNGGSNYRSTCRIYSFSMTDDGKTVCDFIPVRRVSDDEPGFYDVAATDPATAFHANKRTGAKLQLGEDLIGFKVAAIPPQPYDGVHACEPAPAITARATGAELDPADFTIAYAGNAEYGTATVTVTAKAGTVYAGQSTSVTFPVGEILRVDGYTRATEGDGRSWSSPMSLVGALGAAKNNDFLYVKAGTLKVGASVDVAKPLTIKGGFAGTDDVTMAETPLTILDTDRSTAFGSVMSVTAATAGLPVQLVNLGFKYGYARGLYKKNASDLVVDGCLFMTNGLANAGAGKGALVESSSGATVTFRNSEFRANRQEDDASGSPQPALTLGGCKKAVVEGCSFFGNSIKFCYPGTGASSGKPLGDKFTCGGACYTTVPTTFVGCRFSGNSTCIRSSSTSGGTVWFADGSSGSVVSNCFFYGNFDRASWNCGAHQGGAIVQSMGAAAQTLRVVGSTFAYNLADGTDCAAGISLVKGTLYLEDCVFGGNMVNWATTSKSNDLIVKDDGIAHVRNTVFGQEKELTHACTAKGTLDLGEGVVYADPLFVTRPEWINEFVVKYNTYSFSRIFKIEEASYAKLESIDAHLLSAAGYRTNGDATFVTADVHSPAIDGAAATAPVGAEPAPNAGRRNAGFWGGTAEASMSSLGVPTIADADISVEFDALTHPTVNATIGGATAYNATFRIETFASDPRTDATAAAIESAVRYGAQSGATLQLVGEKLYVPGTTLYVRVTASVPGLDPVVFVKEAEVQGELPIYYGHGGGANVIHVRGGANEACDGHDWTDAFPTLEQALAVAAADEAKDEIWIMGTAASTEQITTAFCPAAAKLTIRGGFTGAENDAASRPADGVSVVDGQSIYNSCILANTTGHDVEIERVAFIRMAMNGISKSGGGDLSLYDCQIATNAWDGTQALSWTEKGSEGKGLRVTAASGATIVISNCVFRENRMGGGNQGAAIHLSGCARAEIRDTRVIGSNLGLWAASTGGQGQAYDASRNGSAIWTSVPILVDRCAFYANVNLIRDSWTGGGTIWFAAGSQGSAVSNTLFCANLERAGWNNGGKTGGVIGNSFANTTDSIELYGCTFAYNIADGKESAGAINARKGTINVINCVFGGNLIPASATAPSYDIRVKSDGIVNISHSVVGGEKATHVVVESGGAYNEGEGVAYLDPLFVTRPAEVEEWIVRSGSFCYLKNDDPKTYPALEAIDVHLLSSAGYRTNGAPAGVWLRTDGVNSAAIDAGTGDYVNEPDFNGNCRNAGIYGNTTEASKTYRSVEPLGFDNLAVTYPDGYSRPQIEFDVTGDAGCLVTVHAVVTVGGEELVYDLPGCAAGEKSTILLSEYYERGTALSVVLSGTSSSGTVTGTDMETTIEADRPVWYGHGGGEGVLHLWSGAPGRGDGSDWHNAFTKWADLVAAYNKTNGITEIWIIDTASPTAVAATLNVTTNLAIRGGFAYTNDTAEARTPGAISTLDARKLFGLVYLSNGAGKDVEVERLVFTRATDTGFVKSGAGNITFTDCSFVANARDLNGNYNGRGVRITGTASTTEATFVNCVFAGNAAISGGGYNLGYGAGGYFKDLSRVTLDGCLFVSNGVNICAGPTPNYGGDVSQGSAAYFNNAPLTARNCRFACNNGTCRSNSNIGGGALRFAGASGGSVMMNCAIVGSFDRAGWTGTDQLGSHGGAIVVAFSDAEQTLDLENCTVAYNLSDGKDCPGGLLVSSGTVTALNSIFFGNQRNGYSKDNGAGSDVVVRSGSKFTAKYCLFTDDTTESVTSADAAGKDIDWETCLTGDPLFVTPLEAYLAKTAYNGKYRYHTGSYDFYANLDVHLQSRGGHWLNDGTEVTDGVVTSQAIDKGDPTSDCSQEPPFNGECVNLGAYGNTEHASRTSFGQPKVDVLEVVYTNGYSRPWISLKLGLESGDPCSCDVTITCTTGDVVVASQSFVGVATGDWVRFAPSVYLNAGDGLKVAVTVSAPGATPVEETHEGTVTGVKPIWAGKGGGERVIHVRAGADGLATGRDWTDAYPDLKSALAAIKPGYDALWIAGELVVTNALSEPSLTYEFAIRGGFDGHETTPEERHDSIPYATLDFSNKVDGVRLSSTMPLTVERVRFTRATSCGFYKTGKGQTILANCVFAQNTGGSAVSGRGAYLSCDGNVNTGTIGLITNCVFEGNCLTSGTKNGSGVGLYVANFRSVEIVDTLFVSNGVAWAAAAGYNSPGRDGGQGAALFSDTAPIKARNVRFLANRITTRNDNRGGIVIVNNSRGSVFANCLWLGNQETFGWNTRDYTGSYSGALVMNLGHSENEMTVENCTIALNLSDQTGSGSGITVRGGRLNLRNSIVAGNLTGNYCTGSRDLTVLSGASADVSYTLFSSNDVSSVSASVVPGAGVLYGDPVLVTRTADAKALVAKSGVNVRFAADKLEEVAAFNGHLRGLGGYYDETDGQRRAFRGNSPALDAGDPAVKCVEPHPNGCRVNMGAYGNTPWATMAKPGTLIFVR